MYQLVITLQSALCAADGDGFASIIDTDIVTDSRGIPYLPARRLKGCLKEAAKYIDSMHIEEIFGVRGQRESGSLHISNAVLADHDAVVAASSGCRPQRMTELFTESIASTAIEEGDSVKAKGSVKDNSLRFMRAVSAFTPWNTDQPMVFLADVEIDEQYAAEFGRICKALRHIGYKRNRGFGAVLCRLEKTKPAQYCSVPDKLEDTQRYTLTYAVHLDEPLMLPGKALDETQDFISGQQVIGALAGAYLRTHDADAAFEALFLSDSVRFSNLYLTDDDLNEYIPVPQYLGKSKAIEDKGILNMLEKEKNKGKIIKPIKKGYITKGLENDIINARTERVYHNAVENLKTENKGGLYTQNCLQAGQYMRGTITASGAQMRTILHLLETEPLRFGRSKTAQYAKCSLAAWHVEPERTDEQVQIAAGQYTIYALTSDVILMDAYGNYDVSETMLCTELGITDEIDSFSSLKYTVIKGFLKVTGLQKAHIRALAAGSVIIVKAKETCTLPAVKYIGEQQNAGFGQVRIFQADQLMANAKNVLASAKPKRIENEQITQFFADTEAEDNRTRKAVRFVRDHIKTFSEWNPAFVGRVTLMTKQSKDLEDLQERLKCIKTKAKRSQALDLSERVVADEPGGWDAQKDYLLTILTVLKYRKKQKALEDARKEEKA